MKNLIIAIVALAVLGGLCFAKDKPATGNVQKFSTHRNSSDGQANTYSAKPVITIRENRKKLAVVDAQEQADLKTLRNNAKAAIAEVRADTSLTTEQKKVRIDALKNDYKTQRKAVRKKNMATRAATGIGAAAKVHTSAKTESAWSAADKSIARPVPVRGKR